MKILLAEDDPKTRDYVRVGLMQAGHSVEAVGDGRDALTHCLYNPVDVVVLDGMPAIKGLLFSTIGF